MQQAIIPNEEWLRILTKGMVTIPKPWREEFNLKEGDIIKAKKTAKGIVFEPPQKKVPYRIYTQKDLKQFIKDDLI
jgi:AbrB family looped-hinge helix DNA binding protein